MTAAAADDRGSPEGVGAQIRASTATVAEITALLREPIETFRQAAPLGVSDCATVAANIGDLNAWAARTQRRIGTLSDLAAGSASVAVRVDVDMAIADSPTIAQRALSDVRATWSVLHTAGYAGYWADGIWYRHVAMASLYQELAQHGELALHLDPFGLARSTTLDPSFAVRDELDWLRDAVGPVRGVSAHDAAPVHGAENFEIFRQWKLDVGGIERAEPYTTVAASLDATAVGIEWCAGAPRPGPGGAPAQAYLGPPPPWPLQNDRWMRLYLHDGPYCRWFDGCDVWLIGNDRWVLSDRVNDRYLHAIDWETVRVTLDGLDSTVPVSFCLHPVYIAVPGPGR